MANRRHLRPRCKRPERKIRCAQANLGSKLSKSFEILDHLLRFSSFLDGNPSKSMIFEVGKGARSPSMVPRRLKTCCHWPEVWQALSATLKPRSTSKKSKKIMNRNRKRWEAHGKKAGAWSSNEARQCVACDLLRPSNVPRHTWSLVKRASETATTQGTAPSALRRHVYKRTAPQPDLSQAPRAALKATASLAAPKLVQNHHISL